MRRQPGDESPLAETVDGHRFGEAGGRALVDPDGLVRAGRIDGELDVSAPGSVFGVVDRILPSAVVDRGIHLLTVGRDTGGGGVDGESCGMRGDHAAEDRDQTPHHAISRHAVSLRGLRDERDLSCGLAADRHPLLSPGLRPGNASPRTAAHPEISIPPSTGSTTPGDEIAAADQRHDRRRHVLRFRYATERGLRLHRLLDRLVGRAEAAFEPAAGDEAGRDGDDADPWCETRAQA